MAITLIRGLITPFITTHEPPSKPYFAGVVKCHLASWLCSLARLRPCRKGGGKTQQNAHPKPQILYDKLAIIVITSIVNIHVSFISITFLIFIIVIVIVTN